MKKLYRFSLGYGYGALFGIFSEEEEVVEAAIGKSLSFGEVLGKHSDVHTVLSDVHLKLLSEDQKLIAQFDELGLATGYNPLNYLEEEEDCEEE